MNLPTCSEKELIARVTSGDERAFHLLFNHYHPLVYAFARAITRSSFLSEEIVQEVFMKIWSSREQLARVEHFRPYLKVVAKNVAINHIKRIALERSIFQDLSAGNTVANHVTGDEVITNELQQIINDSIAALPPRQREIFLMHRRDNMKQQEIAARAKISIHTVKEHVRKATASIRAYLDRRVEIIVMAALQEFFR
ncbi:MAG: RNA polymerase sigma-70 factor [Odoribacteraceae bacterium]|jgi:RNA polymerase sigma-70 factor (ECF subfamily)|nr:RNA polymerase sigma-70 factor [Odoribacteraceae bacterium]